MKNTSRQPSMQGKRLLASIFLAAALAWGAGVCRAANVLFNGNLDQVGLTSQVNPCPLGWQVVAFKSVSGAFFDGGDSETWCNVVDTNGYGFFFKPFQGDVANQDLLTVYLYQDNPATPNTKFTLSGYAACEADFCGLFTTNSPNPSCAFEIEFLDASGAILSSNGFNLLAAGMPTGGSGSMSSFDYTTPQVTAPAGAVTVRAGASLFNAYSTTGAQSFFVDGFDLESTAPAGSPVITTQPAQASVSPGGTAQFTVTLANSSGVTFQWQHAGTNISNGATGSGATVSGATTGTLTITGVTGNEVGHYRVLVSNASGSVYSVDAPLIILGATVNPVLSIAGKTGDTYRIDYTLDLNNPTWTPLSTNKLTSATFQYVDPTPATLGKRFYRAVFLY